MKRRPAPGTRMATALLISSLMGTMACAHYHELRLRTYVNDAVGLREGAPVRIQGVDLGKVTVVRVRPQQGRPPVEIDMLLQPTYELPIPTDAKVRLETDGILGLTFAEIDVIGASGPLVAGNGVLQAQEQRRPTVEELISKITQGLQKPCRDGDDPPGSAAPSKSSLIRR